MSLVHAHGLSHARISLYPFLSSAVTSSYFPIVSISRPIALSPNAPTTGHYVAPRNELVLEGTRCGDYIYGVQKVRVSFFGPFSLLMLHLFSLVCVQHTRRYRPPPRRRSHPSFCRRGRPTTPLFSSSPPPSFLFPGHYQHLSSPSSLSSPLVFLCHRYPPPSN